jgi:hypothetical protein
MRKVGVSLVVAAIASAGSAWAADYPKPYESKYEMTMAGAGTQQIHYMSDGKGHVRTETTNDKGETTFVLMDYPQHTLTTAMNMSGQNRYMKSPLPDYQEGEPIKQDAKDLGTKVIDNHQCHGYEKTYKNGQASQIWIEDKTDHTIMTETVGPEQKTISTLKLWVDKAPTFTMDLPSDYKPYP